MALFSQSKGTNLCVELPFHNQFRRDAFFQDLGYRMSPTEHNAVEVKVQEILADTVIIHIKQL